MITNAAQQVVWRRDNTEPFGDSVPDENPSGLGVFDFPIGLGGYHYRDKETDRWHNWMRSYAAAFGRFDQSDVIGLSGGVNTYLYVAANPLKFVDPDGAALCDPSDTMCGIAMRNAGIQGPYYPVTEPPPTPVSCNGRWIQVRFTRNFGSVFTGSCTCYWSCYSCPGGADAFPNPNPGQYSTSGKLFFDPNNYGKDFSPKKGDKCFCPKPGPESSCKPCEQ